MLAFSSDDLHSSGNSVPHWKLDCHNMITRNAKLQLEIWTKAEPQKSANISSKLQNMYKPTTLVLKKKKK